MSFVVVSNSYSQLHGSVFCKNGKQLDTLSGAKMLLLKAQVKFLSNQDGSFMVPLNFQLPDTLITSYPGFHNDTLIITKANSKTDLNIILYSDLLLAEVVIEAKKKDYGILKMKILNIENIGSGEIRKAACCNLSESFQTNTSVDVTITDAVSGAKKLQMMGIDGVYTQIQMENIPYLRGLESSFGLSAIPGTWIESIQITKGTGSVVNGYESMAGLINLEFKKPGNMERFYFNAYLNHFGRSEINADGNYSLSKKLTGAWFVHGATFRKEIDMNRDGFRDVNLSDNVSVLNRWVYHGKNLDVLFGVNGYYQGKTGGQNSFVSSSSSNLYGVHSESKHIDAFAKTGFLLKKRDLGSIGVLYNAKLQETTALFGVREFIGTEKRAYINSIYEDIIGTTDHKIKAGLSFTYSDVQQQMDSVSGHQTVILVNNKLEYIPGAFAEYTKVSTRLTTVFGARLDYTNLYGLQFTPRFYGKYELTENIDLRFTSGKGFRTPNVIIDNISLMASSRNWIVDATIMPESSWNFGGSLSVDFMLKQRKNNFTLDFYRTQFVNQLVVDREISFDAIYFLNSKGKSYSNTLQAEINFSLSKTFELRFTYKLMDVKAEYNQQLEQQIMTQKHRWLTNISYTSRNKKWEANATGVLNGKMRMNMLSLTYGPQVIDKQTPMYVMINAQVTYIHKKWDFYVGGENLSNYRIKSVIIDAENPFGAYFDATMVWGPLTGLTIYGGVRYKLKHSKKENEILKL